MHAVEPKAMSDHYVARLFADIVAAGAVVGSLAGFLPYVASVLGVIWYVILLLDRFWLHPPKSKE